MVSTIPIPIDTTPTRANLKSMAISLGRSRRRAAKLKTPANTAPPRTRNAPSTWRNSSQSYVSTASSLRVAVDVRARHLRLLTETIAAVNSTLDLEEVLGL